MPDAGRALCANGCFEEGANVAGVDLSPAMVEQARLRCGEKGRFLVADLARPLALAPGSFDGVTCSLALHYLKDWDVALTSFARVLRPGGWAVISLDHPSGPPLASQQGGYFDQELVSETWTKAGMEVTQHYWRRPLAAATDAFADAGFVIERLAEPQPAADDIRRFPAELKEHGRHPCFIVYRLRLTGLAGPPGV